MEEEATVTTVDSVPRTNVRESLELEFVNVTFRVHQGREREGKVAKAIVKEPAWLSKLEPSAPLDGYLVEHGGFSASFAKDDRIRTGLKVTIELNYL